MTHHCGSTYVVQRVSVDGLAPTGIVVGQETIVTIRGKGFKSYGQGQEVRTRLPLGGAFFCRSGDVRVAVGAAVAEVPST